MSALEDSIAHWEENVAATSVDQVKLGNDHCALCRVYNKDDNTDPPCTGCPISNATGERYCEGSPYQRVLREYWAVGGEGPVTNHLKAAMQEELEFLQSLRTPMGG